MWDAISEFFLQGWIFLLALSSPVLLGVSSIGFGLATAMIVYSLWKLHSRIPSEDREYKDPVPPLLKPAWWLVQILAYYVCTNLPIKYLNQLEARLQQTGVSYMMNAEQFFAIRIISAGLFPIFIGLALVTLGKTDFLLWVILGFIVLGYFYPLIWLGETKKKREKQVVRDLPMYLEFITMAVEAGLNLTGAMSQAIDKGPPGPLKHEFLTVMRDLRSGLSRAESLERMASRLDIKDVSNFIRSVIQAEKLGTSMGKVLKIQTEQRRMERFNRAEKMAMEAPVKLIFPLIVFIFPVTFIILAFPIVIKFMDQGFM